MTAQSETITYLALSANRQLVRIIEKIEYEPSTLSTATAGRVPIRREIQTADGRPVVRDAGQFVIYHHGELEPTTEINSAIQITWRPHPCDRHWIAHGELRAVFEGEIRIAREVELFDNRDLVIDPILKLAKEEQVRTHIRTALLAILNASSTEKSAC